MTIRSFVEPIETRDLQLNKMKLRAHRMRSAVTT
jgi:hypothetical protein